MRDVEELVSGTAAEEAKATNPGLRASREGTVRILSLVAKEELLQTMVALET